MTGSRGTSTTLKMKVEAGGGVEALRPPPPPPFRGVGGGGGSSAGGLSKVEVEGSTQTAPTRDIDQPLVRP